MFEKSSSRETLSPDEIEFQNRKEIWVSYENVSQFESQEDGIIDDVWRYI